MCRELKLSAWPNSSSACLSSSALNRQNRLPKDVRILLQRGNRCHDAQTPPSHVRPNSVKHLQNPIYDIATTASLSQNFRPRIASAATSFGHKLERTIGKALTTLLRI